MDSARPDLDKIKNDLHSLDPHEYIQFMSEVHFECPFKTIELTDKIVNNWKNDHSMKTEDFNKLIKAREAEYKEKVLGKRQGNLSRIQDLKSRTGLEPLRLFPKEIWLMLLNQLPPEDKYNFRQVHETFQDLTNDTLVGDILLPMILPFKVEHFWGKPLRPIHPRLVGLISQKLRFCPLAQFAELRLVSKTLRNAVDKWFEDDIISNLRSGQKNARPSIVTSVNLRNLESCQKFARMRNDLSDNNYPLRFYTRSLEIISPQDGTPYYNFEAAQRTAAAEQLSQFPGNIDEILDHIGDQIWYFSFDFTHPIQFSRNDPKFYERYTSFLGWLGKMPQLKWLKVTINEREKDSRCGFRLPEGSPPALRHLERLDLEFKRKNRYPLPACVKLLTAYSEVKILSLRGLKSLLKKKYGFVGPVPVSQLALEVLIMDDYPIWADGGYDDYDGSSRDKNFQHDEDDENFKDPALFESIIQSNWPLRQIDWELDMGNFLYEDGIYGIFNCLGKVKTLEKIRLSLDDVAIQHEAKYLELPNLTHLEFKVNKSMSLLFDRTTTWSFLFSLQFLIFAKKLKTLIWNCETVENGWKKLKKDLLDIDKVGSILDFDWVALKLLGFVEDYGDIEESNIWRIFRELETVVVGLAVRVQTGTLSTAVEKSVAKKFRRRELELKKTSLECSSSKNELVSVS